MFHCRHVTTAVTWTVLGSFVGCAPAEQQEEEMPDEPITLAEVGFATPESVRHDARADVYLVSNINGDPFTEDDNGFISRVSPAGEVIELKWIDGTTEGVTLNAPKGLALSGETLYVADINTVRMFNRSTGEPMGDIPITGATFLNDVAVAADGSMYITDSGFNPGFEPSGTDAVYRIVGGTVETVVSASDMGGPNGITVSDGNIWVVTFGSGELYRITDGSITDRTSLPPGGLDGVEIDGGQVFVSSWEGNSILRGVPDGTFEVVASGVEAPADIGIDTGRHRLLIPLFLSSEVRIVPIEQASSE